MLYRKYRPINFKEIVGQNHVKITLQNEIQTNSIAHAYLFCGPRAVGKTTFARVLAKTVNCLNRKEREYEPCNRCTICMEITNGKSLDVIEIDAASHTGVDNVRENIITSARTVPSRCRYKIFIIDEAHMLSISAFNALLKIIEEPPINVIFILCTTEVHKVPTTIISRCQRFDFKHINVSDIIKKLSHIIKKEKISVDKKILESIARHSEGYMRDAESLLSQILAISGNKITQETADLVIPRSDINEIINLINNLTQKDSINGLRLINNLINEGIDLKKFINDLIEMLRKIMLNKINPGLAENLGLEFGEVLEMKINQVGQNLSLWQLISFIKKFLEIKNQIKDSFIIQLPIELAIIELCLPADSSDNQAIVQIQQSQKNIIPEILQNISANSLKQKSNSNLDKKFPKITKEQIMKKWHEVIVKLKNNNHSLSFMIENCEIKNIECNTLSLAFQYKLHKDRINNPKIKQIAERILLEVYKQPLIINATVQDKKNNTQDNEKNMINNVLTVFGGEVVN